MKIPKFEAQTEWVKPTEFPDLRKVEEIAIDLETKDPDLLKKGSGSVIGNGEVIGIAVATKFYKGYFPIAHEGGGNMDRTRVLSWLKDILESPSTKVFHNAIYDVCWLRAMGFKINGDIACTMIAAAVTDENRFRYDLNSLSWHYLGYGKNESALAEAASEWGIDPKSEMYKLPAMHVGAYAERDAEVTLGLWQEMKKEIISQDLEDIFDLESDLFHCLVDMRFKGVRVDIDKAHKIKNTLIQRENTILDKIKKLTNVDVEIWAAASIAKVFDYLKLPYDRTAKTNKPSFTKNFLANHPHEIAKDIASAREINKAHTTFIDTILKHSHNGRIHAEINQIRSDQGGTVTGRFSYNNPNLQQIPARNKELGPMIRSLFIPEDGCKWGVFDYSQQEPRLVVHYAALQNLYGVGDVLDAYQDGDVDFHQIVADMAEIPREQAKTINLGLFYGMGKNKLQAELGVSKEDAEDLFRTYHDKVPFVKMLMESVMRRAQDKGRVRTLLGRRCRFNLWEPNQFGIHKALNHEDALAEHGPGIRRAFTYKALNRLIQGSSADQTKKAMVDCYDAGLTPMLTVHDELCFNIQNDKQVEQIKEINNNNSIFLIYLFFLYLDQMKNMIL